MQFVVEHSYLIPLLPLIGAAIAGLFGARGLKQQSHWPIWLGVGASAVLSIILLVGMVGIHPAEGTHAAGIWFHKHLYTWIQAGNFRADAGFFLDPLSATMLCVVCGIGFFITVFSKGYMAGDRGYFRFFAYLGLFIFSMTILVMGDNFILLYLGWEGVGLCSYLLIGYFYEKPAAREAAKKAFIVNRIGDFGFGIGIMLIFLAFGSVSYFGTGPGTHSGVFELAQGNLNSFQQHALQWIPFWLMIGAFGKSAQFPLYVWLPDAMEGPSPVSALIHAATMVTAGIYMIARCGTLFIGNTAAMATVAAIGAFTALLAATIALRQFDLKKVFAYSTISQLGFMFVGVGVMAPVAAMFHLITHAFFKALLFLSSGVVMHAMMGELDMRKMSGLRRVLPKTRIFMLVGCAALAGFPLMSGFFSKDEIVAASWASNKFLGVWMLFTAFLTAYYTFRLYFRVFEGPEVIPTSGPAAHGDHDHADDHAGTSHGHDHGHDHNSARDHGHHNHEPLSMTIPLAVLAIGAIVSGFLLYWDHSLGHFLGQSPSLRQTAQVAVAKYGSGAISPPMLGMHDFRAHEVVEREHSAHLYMMIISGAIALLGIWLAYLLHLKNRTAGDRLAARFPGVTRLLEAKYWVDEIYQSAIVDRLRGLGRAFFMIDRFVVDGIVWLVGFVPQLSGFALKLTTQRGYLQGYAVTMLFGVAVVLLLVFKIF